MLFSAFAPFGALAFSGKPTHEQSVYEAMARNYGGAISFAPGSHEEATLYARARSIARGMHAIDRANNQYDGRKAVEMLPGLERDYDVTPGERDTVLTRQRNVAARQAIPQDGAEYLAIKNTLKAVLGSAFVALRATPSVDRALSASTPNGNFTDPSQPPKQVLLTDPTPIGTWTALYTNADPSAPPVTLLVGDSLAVQPGNSGLVEIVTVTAVARGTFTATFTKGHDAGVIATTQSFPNWWSTQRSYFVILTPAAAIDAPTLRLIHEYMARVCRGVTQWCVIASSATPLRSGPFTLGDASLGLLGPVPHDTLIYTL